jgi:cell division septation protein DedD
MSSYTVRKSVAPASASTKYCDVCFRKGLSKSEYTSHYTKSIPGPRGIVVCPTILNSSCKVCGQNGHWANEKFCPELRRRSKETRQMNNPAPVITAPAPIKKNINVSGFAVLNDDPDSDSEKDPVVAPIANTWAKIAEKEAVKKVTVESDVLPSGFAVLGGAFKPASSTEDELKKKEAHAEALRIMRERAIAKPRTTLSWSAPYDSDTDEED